MALVTVSSARWRRTRTPRASRVNQATCSPASTACCPRASSRNVLPVPAGPQTTRFSARPIHSRVRSAAWVGAGIEDSRRVPGGEGLAGGEPRPGPAGGQRGPVPAGDLLGQQRFEHLGGVPALRFGGGQQLGGGAADIRQPHPPQQPLQLGVQRRGAGCGSVMAVGHGWPRSPSSSAAMRSAMCGQQPAACSRVRVPGEVTGEPVEVGAGGCRRRRRASRRGRRSASPTPTVPRPRRRPAGRGHRRPVGGEHRSRDHGRSGRGSPGHLGLSETGLAESGSPNPAHPAVPWARLWSSPARPAGPGSAVAWWDRIAARSPSAEPARGRGLPERAVHHGGAVQPGQLDRLGHLGPDPRAARGGGLGQPQRRAVTERQERRLAAVVRGRGVRSSAPAGAGGKCASATRGLPGVVLLVAGDLDRATRPDVHDHDLLAVAAHPHRLPDQGVRHRVLAVLERDHRGVRRRPCGSPRTSAVNGVAGSGCSRACSSASISAGARRVTRCARALTCSENSAQAASSSAKLP